MTLLALIWACWFLFIRGFLWKSILFFTGWVGIQYLLLTYVSESRHTTIIFNHPFSWAAVIATLICFLALLTTKD